MNYEDDQRRTGESHEVLSLEDSRQLKTRVVSALSALLKPEHTPETVIATVLSGVVLNDGRQVWAARWRLDPVDRNEYIWHIRLNPKKDEPFRVTSTGAVFSPTLTRTYHVRDYDLPDDEYSVIRVGLGADRGEAAALTVTDESLLEEAISLASTQVRRDREAAA